MKQHHCTTCNVPLTIGREHIFEDTSGDVISRYCDVHCPRCWADRREVGA